jgi:GH15 family glucan-1,4-alpha-glucosidase
MAQRIEDYALIGDCQTAALVGRNGSIDWLCLPRFDSGACFASLLGTPRQGRWLLCPTERGTCRWRYRDNTLVLLTEHETKDGLVEVSDFMPLRDGEPHLVRIVEGRRGQVAMRMELILRPDYGSIVPWVRKTDEGLSAVAGPDALVLRTPVLMRGENLTTLADFTVRAGERVAFALTWYPSHRPVPEAIDPESARDETVDWWQKWSGKCNYDGPWKEAVMRSLITLKALTYAPTGGIVAAATTSLPEWIGSVRNWDYRFCWLRDATFTLYALLENGYVDEARAWGGWLLRAVAGSPQETQIMYGLAGEPRLTEWEVPWLSGYEKSRPVRVGNAASEQFQLDVYGEVIDAMYQSRAGVRARLRSGAQLFHAVLRLTGTRRQPADDAAGRLPAHRGPARARHRGSDPAPPSP